MTGTVRPAALLAALLVAGGLSSPARAWGPNGHAIVADIAQAHLTPEALAEARTLLAAEGHNSLDQVASWPDTIGHLPRKAGGAPETLAWHYVDTSVFNTVYEQQRDCPDKACVTEKLPEQERILADRSAPAAERLAALKWVVHLVGDIHQPLHTAERDHDKGGNAVRLSYYGNTQNGHMNLHSLWDEGVIDHATGLSVGPHYTISFPDAAREADKLNGQITETETAFWTRDIGAGHEHATAVAWTDESHALAETIAYGALTATKNAELGDDYTSLAWPVIRLRLEQAGIRLAAVLNVALGQK